MRADKQRNPLDVNNPVVVDPHEVSTRPLSPEVYAELADARAESRGFDQAVLGERGMNPSTRAVSLAYPQPILPPLRDKRMDRDLPAPDSLRTIISDRQVRERHKIKTAAQNEMPKSEVKAITDFVTAKRQWRNVNARLARVHGDATLLSDEDGRYVRRLDRGMGRGERLNERGSVVAVKVRLPKHINHTNIEGYLRNQCPIGREFEFDKYMMGAHNLHEVAPHEGETERMIVFEFKTRRGMYVGASHQQYDDTTHVLPRGMRGVVAAPPHVARFRRPDGSIGETLVVQLVDRDEIEGEQ